jgi:hypothetical protein
MTAMLRTVARAWPFALVLGCVTTVSVPPTTTTHEAAREQPPQPVELENETEPSESEPPAAATEATEPSEDPPEPATTGGHVVRPADPVASPGTVPTIEAKQPVVGEMDKDVIRRIVRAHIHEIRDCYNKGLAQDPTLAGKIAIEFTIGPSGKVEEAKAVDVTGFADPEVPKCIAEAIETWTFPEPRGGGRVTVSYPFNLVPG